MNLSSRQIFEKLLKIMDENEIFTRCEFSKERFMRNLEKEDRGEIDQMVIKQYFRLQEILPIGIFTEESKSIILQRPCLIN
jgi:hypothetical protein